MTQETIVLLLLPLLGLVYVLAGGGIPRIVEQGWAATFYGTRDNLPDFDGKYAQRLQRANENFKESVPYALALLLLVQVLGVADATSAAGAWTFFWARVVYIPVYTAGIPLLRSATWGVSILGLGMIALPIVSAS